LSVLERNWKSKIIYHCGGEKKLLRPANSQDSR